MRQHLAVYRQLPGQTYLLSAGEFMLHLVNSAFLLIFNIYLSKLGYADSLIGSLTSMRYLGVLLAAIPIGLYIRGRLLRPLFLISGVGLPLVSCLLLWVVPWQVWSLTLGLMFLWGLLFVLMQVCIQPYMIRQVPPAHYAEAFALHYAVVPLSQVAAGGLIALAGIWMNPVPDERIILLGISGLGLLSVFFFARLQDNLGASTHPHTLNLRSLRGSYQWRRILRALIPTLLLATGAGFTFPFINLFFYQVFGIDSGAFGLMGAGSSLLVFGMVVAGPALKRQFGFGWTISGSQAIAVLLLIGLALCQLYGTAGWALPTAIVLFLFRAPLMKLAQPMAGELTILYVGPRNREIISAFTSSIWSGSWVIGSQLFALLRAYQLPYWQIFLFTAAMYTLGILAYARLIQAVGRMPKAEASDPLN